MRALSLSTFSRRQSLSSDAMYSFGVRTSYCMVHASVFVGTTERLPSVVEECFMPPGATLLGPVRGIVSRTWIPVKGRSIEPQDSSILVNECRSYPPFAPDTPWRSGGLG